MKTPSTGNEKQRFGGNWRRQSVSWFESVIYLWTRGQSDQEVDAEEAGHEDFSVSPDDRIFVAQCRDDGFRSTELKIGAISMKGTFENFYKIF